jgi:general secretion pathway protein J
VEVLVSIAIFTIVAMLAYGSYNLALHQSDRIEAQMARLREVQTTVRLLTQDFEQLSPRPVRDVLGQSLVPALNADGKTEILVSLTRAGWTNPSGQPRSSLQRVQYVLDNGTLRREHWQVLDATLSNQPVRREILTKVRSIKFRYLDRNSNWTEQWPAPGAPPIGLMRSRPIAVELTLELEDFGAGDQPTALITRLIEVGG